jgi:cytosine/adenosine deaminase-related metal-dependent hydrolase
MVVTIGYSQSVTKRHPTLYINATVIMVNATRDVILDGGILVNGSNIVQLGKTSAVLEDLRESIASGQTKIKDCKNKIIIPGLINTHAHLAQSLLRGLAEDLDLHSWLCDAIWPLEANYQGKMAMWRQCLQLQKC